MRSPGEEAPRLTSSQRKKLASSGHALSPAVTLGESDVSDASVAHVRRQFLANELVKVRVNTRDRQIFESVVEQLAGQVPCEVVQRVGRVALLFQPASIEKPDPAP